MDPFATLGLQRAFRIDLPAVEKTHRELSRALHPDRFVAAPPGERREALSRAVAVNEAFRAVRDPIRRAEALFTLSGIEVGETREPKPSPALLMNMMDEREALAEAKSSKDRVRLEKLALAIKARSAATEAALAQVFDAAGTGPTAKETLSLVLPKLGELRFYRRFLDEVSAIEDDWDEASAPNL